MDTNISMVQGDAAPSRIFALSREDGTIPDLSLVNRVDFLIFRPDDNSQTNGTGNNNQSECTILPPANAGKVQYDWSTTDLPIAGVYRCLLRITYADNDPETTIIYVNVESDTT